MNFCTLMYILVILFVQISPFHDWICNTFSKSSKYVWESGRLNAILSFVVLSSNEPVVLSD